MVAGKASAFHQDRLIPVPPITIIAIVAALHHVAAHSADVNAQSRVKRTEIDRGYNLLALKASKGAESGKWRTSPSALKTLPGGW